MYQPEYDRKPNGAPILRGDELDTIGERLVSDFLQKPLLEPQEIDIDRFSTRYLKMGLDFKYLSHCGVYLGMTVFSSTDRVPVYVPELKKAKYIHANARTIILDETLLEENQEHRYRFTLGHESSHGILHEAFFLRNESDCSLYDLEAKGVRCRADSYRIRGEVCNQWTDLKRVEWQANRLSAAILMPKSMVKILAARRRFEGRNEQIFSFVDEMSSVFNVSIEAACYRLVDLGIADRDYYSMYGQLSFLQSLDYCAATVG